MKSYPFSAILGSAVFVLTSMAASAHPGHYHPPGEEDEFDAFRADWLHLHGWFEITLALTALAAVIVFQTSRRSGIRLGAACAFGGSLALIAIR